MPSILFALGLDLALDSSYALIMELAKLLQRPNRSIVASGTEADERMTGGELIYIRNRKAQK